MKNKFAKRLVVAAILTSWVVSPASVTFASVYENGLRENGGAIDNSAGASLTIESGSLFQGNTATASYQGGGAIYNAAQGHIEIGDGVTFDKNYLTGVNTPMDGTTGGAIASWGGSSVSIGKNASFTNNGYTDSSFQTIGAASGGAIYMSGGGNGVDPQAVLSIDSNAKFLKNATTGAGAAIYAEGASITIGADAEFANNYAESGAAAIYNYQFNSVASTVTVGDGAKFTDNTAKNDSGGAISNFFGNLGLGNNVKFVKNTAGYAGGAIRNAGTLTIGSNAVFDQNTASADDNGGGAIANSGSATIEDGASFTGNSADFAGGAIFNSGSMTLNDATFDANKISPDTTTSGAGGGAIYIAAAENVLTSITNSTFSNNEAKGNYDNAWIDGGAITLKTGKLDIQDSNFIGNKSDFGGAIMQRRQDSAELVISGNTLFEGNDAKVGGAIAAFSKVTIEGSDLSGDTGVVFRNNKATAVDDGGGALFLGSETITTIKNAIFEGNYSENSGGAIATRVGTNPNGSHNDNSEATLDIINTTFRNNTSASTGGAIDNNFYKNASGSGISITNSSFEGNSAKSGGAIFNHADEDKNSETASIIIAATDFINNTATDKGGAIYSESDMTIKTASADDIIFSGNTVGVGDSKVANDIYAATGSQTSITGDGQVSIGSGLISEASTTIELNESSSLIIEENATADIAGVISTSSDASVTNNGEMTLASTATGTGNLTNNSVLNIDGSYDGKIIQEEADAQIKIGSTGKLKASGPLQAGALKIADGGKIDGTITVTEAVELEVAQSAIFDSTGLQVGGTGSNGHIVGKFNLKNTEVAIAAGSAFTQDLTLSGDSQLITDGELIIGDGTSTNTLTLSNGSNNVSAGKDITISDKATLKLSPDAGKTMILNNDVKSASNGVGTVLVDEKIVKVENPAYDGSDSSIPQYIDKHMGTGTITIASRNEGFTGTYTQNDGLVIVDSGDINTPSVFFGGTNNVNTIVDASNNFVSSGNLVLTENALLASDININGNASVDALQVASVQFVGSTGVVDQETITTGIFNYANADTTGTASVVNVNGAGVHLANGTVIEEDTLTLSKDGVRHLSLSNGSGIDGNVVIDDETALTYGENAFIKEAASVTMGSESKLVFVTNSNLEYDNLISSEDDTALISKIGNGDLSIKSSLSQYTGSLNVLGGSLDLTNTDELLLNNVSVSDSSLMAEGLTIAGTSSLNNGNLEANTLAVAGDFDVQNNSVLSVQGNLSAGNLSVVDSIVSATGDLSVAGPDYDDGNLTISGSQISTGGSLSANETSFSSSTVNVVGDFSAGSLSLSDTTLGVAGSMIADDTMISGQSNLSVAGDSQFNTLALTGNSVLNTQGNIAVANNLTIGSPSGNDSPMLNLMNGSINTVTADTLVVNSGAGIKFDANPRTSEIDSIIANAIAMDPNSDYKVLVTGINFTDSPISGNVTFDVSNLVQDNSGAYGGIVELPEGGVIANSELGRYLVTSSGAGNPILNASLLAINPQMHRGQVATLASWQNQLVVNNMLFDHMAVLGRQLMDDAKTANLKAAAYPQFAPYQYSIKDGSLWYKAYGNFERLSMTKGLSVGNNAYGSLIGADFPLVNLKNGWKLVPTAYVGYNGAHQHFNGVSMYQNGAQLGFMGTAYKNDFITSLLAYGGGYANDMTVKGAYGNGSDTTGNWFAGIASKSAYNFHVAKDLIFQPTAMVTYNAFGGQNWGSNFGSMSMSTGMLNGLNLAPGFNLILNKKSFSLYATAQMVYNLMGGVDGTAGNVDLGYVRMRHSYFEYGLGVMKQFKDRFNGYLQFTIRNGGRTGIGFQGGLQIKVGK